jgi:flavin reductase (DIM6/NTAB) family NADH-FMN oxidoreductase RutF
MHALQACRRTLHFSRISAAVNVGGMSQASYEKAEAEVPVLDERFREAMARVAAPVAVMTAIDENGPHGTTVSAFMSLSMKPPMVVVSLDRNSQLLEIVRNTGRFGVNVLSSGQSALGSAFARKGRGKFAGIEWFVGHGVPRLPDTASWIACATTSLVPAGDHELALGLVLDAQSDPVSQPLTYHLRTFGTHVPAV